MKKKEEPKKEEVKKPPGPTWQEKLAIKKQSEPEKVVPEPKKRRNNCRFHKSFKEI